MSPPHPPELRRLLCLVGCLVCALPCAACAAAPTPGTVGAAGLHPRRLVLIPAGGAPGGAALVRGARREAATLGFRIRVIGERRASAGEQIEAVNLALAAKPVAVVIAAVDRAALLAPVRSLRSAGISVVVLSRTAASAAAAAAVRRAVAGALSSSRRGAA